MRCAAMFPRVAVAPSVLPYPRLSTCGLAARFEPSCIAWQGNAMGGFKGGAGRFASEFESTLLSIVGFYLFATTAILGAVGGLTLAGWAWPRVGWIETTLVVIGIVIGASAGMLAFAMVHERMTEEGRSRALWFGLSLVPGAGVLIAIAELVIRGLRKWSRSGADPMP